MNTFRFLKVFILLLGISMTNQSCSSNAEPRFYVDVERDFSVDNTLNAIVTHFFELKNIPSNLDQNLDIFGLNKENISSINPADAVLTNSTGLMDWSLVSSVEIYAISRINPTNRKQIFNVRERNPSSNNQLRLFNTFADMSDIMKEETFDLEIRLTTIISIPANFTAKLQFNYAVFDEI